MRSTSPLIAVGGVLALVLLIAAVWTADMSTPAALTLTAFLILAAVAVLGANAARAAGQRPPQEADADQRDRMQDRVP